MYWLDDDIAWVLQSVAEVLQLVQVVEESRSLVGSHANPCFLYFRSTWQ